MSEPQRSRLFLFLTVAAICAFFCILTFAQEEPSTETNKIMQTRGTGKVRLVQYEDGKWQLLVNDEPYFVRGVEYSPDTIGIRPKLSNEWMNSDVDENGYCDAPFDSWVDKNKNNAQDEGEERVGDFQLLMDMGCNTIRIYHPDNIDIALLRELYRDYGIRVMMGNFLGAYTVGSDADWAAGTDYTDPEQLDRMKENVRDMVEKFKDEQFILFWMLGNENDSAGYEGNSTMNNTNAAQQPEAYAKFVNEVCEMIKEIDPEHPVGVCNAKFKIMPYYNQFAPAIDIIGMNAYSGAFGFGSLWKAIKTSFDRPVVITEYGGDCYDVRKSTINEEFQMKYHKKAWEDIENNGFSGNRTGNAIGGFAFCWLDKWWLCGSADEHDTENGQWQGPTIDGYFNDEWLGLCGQGNGYRSPFLRQPRPAYFYYQSVWNPQPEQEKGIGDMENGQTEVFESTGTIKTNP